MHVQTSNVFLQGLEYSSLSEQREVIKYQWWSSVESLSFTPVLPSTTPLTQTKTSDPHSSSQVSHHPSTAYENTPDPLWPPAYAACPLESHSSTVQSHHTFQIDHPRHLQLAPTARHAQMLRSIRTVLDPRLRQIRDRRRWGSRSARLGSARRRDPSWGRTL